MLTRALAALGLCVAASAADAAPMRYTVELTGFDFYTAAGFPAAATIVFDLDFDFAANQLFTTDPRIALVSSTLPLGSALGFSYSPGPDWLVISGAEGGITVASGTDDFYISIFSVNDPVSASYFLETAVTRADSGLVAPYEASLTRRSLSVVPLPAAAALLPAALGALVLARRRHGRASEARIGASA